MKLNDIQRLTLREVLSLTEKFKIYFDGKIFEEDMFLGDERFEFETRTLSVSDHDLSQDRIEIEILESWFDFNLYFNLDQEYELDAALFSCGLDETEEPKEIPYVYCCYVSTSFCISYLWAFSSRAFNT